MKTAIQSLLRDDDGATLVEYGLIVSLIAVACIVAVTFLSGQLQTLFSSVGNDL